jgi:hypothetical protein
MYLYEGETLHSFRAGAAITLALSGAQLAEIMAHVGWPAHSLYSFLLLETCQLLRPGGPADLLSSDDSSVAASTLEYRDFNELKNFVSAFPSLKKQ